MGLSENNLLIGLSEEIIQHVSDLCQFKTYNKNELVATREEENRSIFFVISGTYSVETIIGQDHDLRYADLSANDFFGELAAIDGLPRSTDVRCRTAGEVAELQHGDFERMLLNEPEITLRLLKLFSGRLRQTNQRLQDFSATTPSVRVIRQIISLVKSSPHNPGQWLISPTPKHDEIASWTGTSSSFVSAILGQLMHDGIIIRRNRDMLVLDLFALKTLGEK